MAHLLPADDGKVRGDKLGSQLARSARTAEPAQLAEGRDAAWTDER